MNRLINIGGLGRDHLVYHVSDSWHISPVMNANCSHKRTHDRLEAQFKLFGVVETGMFESYDDRCCLSKHEIFLIQREHFSVVYTVTVLEIRSQQDKLLLYEPAQTFSLLIVQI